LGAAVAYSGADQHQRALQFAGFRIELGVRLGDDLVLVLGRVVMDDLLGDDAVFDHPVGGGDEAMLGDLRVGGE
jgi:hypothetical protein